LGIVFIDNSPIDFLILGDIFFHHRVIIFDKEQNRIGFVDNSRLIEIYPNSEFLLYVLDALGLGLLLAAICILVLRKSQSTRRGITNPLSEPLRMNASVEMAQPIEPQPLC